MRAAIKKDRLLKPSWLKSFYFLVLFHQSFRHLLNQQVFDDNLAFVTFGRQCLYMMCLLNTGSQVSAHFSFDF